MGDNTGIEWTDATWNPTVGCSVVSPGCTNCYAMRLAARLGRMGQPRYQGLTVETKAGPVWTGEVRLAPASTLSAPLRWTRPRRIFVNSMSDLFHPAVPDEVVDLVFGIMALCPQHTFQVLTKRPDRMRAWFAGKPGGGALSECLATLYVTWPEFTALHPLTAERALAAGQRGWPLPNVWLGTSVEDQARADERMPHLAECPAAKRFLSCEPLLGPVQVDRRWLPRFGRRLARPAIDWVIVGGESGLGARPMHPDWVRGLRDQCRDAEVAFFFKQWGAWSPGRENVGKHRAGNLLDGAQHLAWPA